MNISSVIVITKKNSTSDVIKTLNSINECEVHMHEGQKLVVSIEAEDIAAETGVMKEIENTAGVVSAKLVFAYSENEIEDEMRKIEQSANLPEWLNTDADAKDIPYSGRLKI
jgi:nitrate reductase NapD